MARLMTFEEALETLRLATTFGINPSLEGVTELVDALGRPQDTFASVQITGTNGKTSTARMTAALLEAEGRRTGLYTSPELQRYPERIEVGGAVVSDADLAAAVSAAVTAAQRLRGEGAVGAAEGFTEFELLTAAALWLFRERGVEVAVLEVGLGGRWDATSVVSPSVAVITGVGLDHTAILGDTVEQIAADKAAIIKPASAPVLGPGTDGLDSIFIRHSDEVGTHARAVREGLGFSPVAEDLTVRFRVAERPSAPGGATVLDVDGVHARYEALAIAAPSYQAANVATAVAAAEAALGRALDASRARTALAALAIPGRFELLRSKPPIFIDGSHNHQAARVLADAIREAFPDADTRPALLLGVLADKDAPGIVAALAPVVGAFAVTQPASSRALSVRDLAAVVRAVTGEPPAQFPSVTVALAALISSAPEGLIVTGSLRTAGEARTLLHDG
ncbi:MAG: Mur ligase family protein [Coriobacteriia bacterium]|nr:Mur ligase family protein [Coriobacteriia bacterium]